MVIVLAVVRAQRDVALIVRSSCFRFTNFVGHARAATLLSYPAGKSSTWRAALCALPVADEFADLVGGLILQIRRRAFSTVLRSRAIVVFVRANLG
jgi:hypothetical protein